MMPYMNSGPLTCPQCYRVEQVQKVTAVVDSGTSHGMYSGTTTGVGYTFGGGVSVAQGRTTISGTTQTALSQQLTPPKKPSYGASEVVGIGGTLLFGFIGFYSFINGLGSASSCSYDPSQCSGLSAVIAGPLICLLLVGLVIFGAIRMHASEKRKAAVEIPRWQRAMARWEQLFYCHRCGGVFLPGERFLVPLGRMLDYLNDGPVQAPTNYLYRP